MNDIVLLNLRISMWGVSRVLPDQQYQVDADKAMVRATKKILECSEYEFLLQLKRSIHRRLRTLALPGDSAVRSLSHFRGPGASCRQDAGGLLGALGRRRAGLG